MKKSERDHVVTNALLRIDRAAGQPPHPFEKPRIDLDFWVLELTKGSIEKLTRWQKRIIPILHQHAGMLKKCRKSGARCFLHVQTDGPMSGGPASFQPDLVKVLADIGGTLEHCVERESEQARRSRAKNCTVPRALRALGQ